jgi:hypothetical protein
MCPIRVARFFLVQTYQIGKNITNDHKLYHPPINYTKWPQNIPNGHKIYQHLPFKGPPKFTQIWAFWFENKPSGNPDQGRLFKMRSSLKEADMIKCVI